MTCFYTRATLALKGLSNLKRIDFKFALYYKQNLELIYYPRVADLNIFRVSSLQEEATAIASIDFVGRNAARLKHDIYAVTNITVEISVHIQIFIPVKVSFFLKGIQKSGLIIEMTISKI